MAATTVATTAAEFTPFVETNGTYTILMTGGVRTGDSDRLSKKLQENPDTTVITMISPGGVADEGYMLAQVIADHHLTTRVPEGTMCASACAIAFTGGDTYDIDGALSFHTAYFMWPPYKKDFNDMFKMGQQHGARDMAHFLSLGFSMDLPTVINQHSDKSIFLTFFSEEQLMAFKTKDMMDSPVEITEDWLDRNVMNSYTIYRYLGILPT